MREKYTPITSAMLEVMRQDEAKDWDQADFDRFYKKVRKREIEEARRQMKESEWKVARQKSTVVLIPQILTLILLALSAIFLILSVYGGERVK